MSDRDRARELFQQGASMWPKGFLDEIQMLGEVILTCATKEVVMADATKTLDSDINVGNIGDERKTKADLAKFIHTDVSLSPLTTFERDQIIDKIAAMFKIK